MRRLLGLVLTSFGAFIALPFILAFGLVLIGLGIVSAVMLIWGVISFVGWICLHDANAGKSALMSLIVGGGAFAILVVAIDAVTGGWSKRKQKQVQHQAEADVPFLELRTNETA